MNFKQLEAFVSVVKYKSFSRAAEEIFLSQPTVSAHVQALESECGATLIIRSTRGVSLSPAGKVFNEYANELLSLRDKALCSVKSTISDISGTLEIAASTVPAQYILPELLSGITEQFPHLFLSIKQCDSRDVIRSVLNMDAELGIAGTYLEDPGCEFEPFVGDRLVVITPNTPKFQAIRGCFPLEMLKTEPFITRESGSGTRKEMEESLMRSGLDPRHLKISAQLDSTESIKHAVSRGPAISIISRMAAEDYVRFGLLRMFDVSSEHFRRQFYFVHRKNWPISPGAEAVMQAARNHFIQGKARG